MPALLGVPELGMESVIIWLMDDLPPDPPPPWWSSESGDWDKKDSLMVDTVIMTTLQQEWNSYIFIITFKLNFYRFIIKQFRPV